MNPITNTDWFPDRVDVANRLVRLVPTTRAILERSAFLDGRTPIAVVDGQAVVRSLAEFESQAPAALRWILHESFCGSTLLARMTAVAARSFVLREPQALVDCANRPERDVVSTIRALLARRWYEDEPIVVKPSNWINPALSALWAKGDRGVTITIAPEHFLIAVLRGGRDRIAYTLRLYEAFARAWPTLARHVDRASPPTGKPLATATGLVMGLHWMQRRLLTMHGMAATIRFPDFLDDPEAALTTICTALDLAPAGDATALLAMHAKFADRPADRAAEARANHAISRHHAAVIADALVFRARLEAMDPPEAPATEEG